MSDITLHLTVTLSRESLAQIGAALRGEVRLAAPEEVEIDKTAEEVGQLIGRAASTVRGFAANGRFPGCYRLGKQLRFPPASIKAFQEKNQQSQTHAPDMGAWRKLHPIGEE